MKSMKLWKVAVVLVLVCVQSCFGGYRPMTPHNIPSSFDKRNFYRIGPKNTKNQILRFHISFEYGLRFDSFCLCFPAYKHGGNYMYDKCRSTESEPASGLCYNYHNGDWHANGKVSGVITATGSKTVELDIEFSYNPNNLTVNVQMDGKKSVSLLYHEFKTENYLGSDFFLIAPFMSQPEKLSGFHFYLVDDGDAPYHFYDPPSFGSKERINGGPIEAITTSLSPDENAATASIPFFWFIIMGLGWGLLVTVCVVAGLYARTGVWCCGLVPQKQRASDDEPPPIRDAKEKTVSSLPTKTKTRTSDEPRKEAPPSSASVPPGPEIAPPPEEKARSPSQDKPADAAEVPPPPPPPPPPPAEKKGKGLVTKDTTTGKTTKDKDDSDDEEDGTSSTVPPTAAGATTPPPPPPGGKEKEQAPNLLLFNTKEDRTQSESKAGGRRKNLIDKKNKEPPVTKGATINGEEVQTGMGKATTRKGEMVKDAEGNYKTGIPRSETDLADPLTKTKPGTKGVSATQGDKYTEYGTQPTQGGTTLATGKTRLKTGTTQGQTLAGTQATQGGTTAYGTKVTQDGGGTMVTGYAKTSRDGGTGQTQVPTAGETGETQIPTGGRTEARLATTQAGTKTTQQYGTGTTQMASTRTTQAGTRGTTAATQGGTRTTQARTLGTTVAATQQGTRTTQGATGTTQGATRYTGETQLPSGNDEHDVEPTQLQPGKTRTGTTQKTTLMATGVTRGPSGTQLPSDDDEADPTQNPTAFTGRTSRTQVGTTAAATTQMGTSKTRTRDTQKATTKRTDA